MIQPVEGSGEGLGLGHVVDVVAPDQRADQRRVAGGDVVAGDDAAAPGHVLEALDVEAVAEEVPHQARASAGARRGTAARCGSEGPWRLVLSLPGDAGAAAELEGELDDLVDAVGAGVDDMGVGGAAQRGTARSKSRASRSATSERSWAASTSGAAAAQLDLPARGAHLRGGVEVELHLGVGEDDGAAVAADRHRSRPRPARAGARAGRGAPPPSR